MSGGWQNSGSERVEQRAGGVVEVIAVQVGDQHARRCPPTTASAGSGRSTSGVGRGLGVFGTASRAPAGSSCGSTSSVRPAISTRRVAERIRVSFTPARLAQDRHKIRRALAYAGDTLGVVNGPLICVIEDEEVIAAAVAARLRAEGFDVEVAHDGHAGVALCERVRPDLVVLDLMLPGLDGLEVCRRVQRDRPVPVLMLTARAEESDLLVGLAVGADDYVTKPFSPRELVARVRALLRRVERRPAPPGRRGRCWASSRSTPPARLRARRRRGRAPDADRVRPARAAGRAARASSSRASSCWPRSGAGATAPGQRTVDSHVRGLRRKLGSDLVRTVHGVGYALEASR